MVTEELRPRAAHYRHMAEHCSEYAVRGLLDLCARDYEAEAERAAAREAEQALILAD